MNGSNANGDCPTECVVMAAGISTCDCTDSTLNLGDEAITASVLIDGVVPTIDSLERNDDGDLVWAAPLFTVNAGSVILGFRFQTRVVLCEVELYVFHCPAWGIGAFEIRVQNGAARARAFPQLILGIFLSIGAVILTSDMQDCTSLTRVSIPLQMAIRTSIQLFHRNQQFFLEEQSGCT